MAKIKKYILDYDYKAEVVVEIDHDILKDELLHEINDFWSGNDERLSECDGNILKAVLRLLGTAAVREEIISMDAVSLFNDGKMEGWPRLDGCCGIKLLKVEELIFDDSDINIKCDGAYL